MQSLEGFLTVLETQGIRLSVVDGRLACDAPRGRITSEIREELARFRDILVLRLPMERNTIPHAERNTTGLPLSWAQHRLWLLDRLEGGSPRYNLISATQFSGPADLPAMRKALQAIVSRHEILRTRFVMAGEDAVQIPLSEMAAVLSVEDMTHMSLDARQTAIDSAVREESTIQFDLSRPPLIRSRLLRFTPDCHVLITNQHHIVTDAWSKGVFAAELDLLYTAFAAGREPALPPLPIQYADFAAWQRNCLSGEKLQAGIDFWTNELRDMPALLLLPTDFPRPATQTYRGDSTPVRLSPELLSGLTALTRDTGTTLFMVLYASLSVCLARYSGATDIPVGVPVANRTSPEVEGLIGFFVNSLVLRCRMEGNPTFRQLLGRVRTTVLAGFAHQETPFEKLVEALHVRRDLSYSPVFQVMLSFQNQTRESPQATPGVTIQSIPLPQTHSLFDLDWQLRETSNGVEGLLSWATDLFNRGTAERMVGHFIRVLETVCGNPDCTVADIDILNAAEHQTLRDWNATGAEYPGTRCLHELLRQQALRTPLATAISCGEESWSYRQLDEAANRIGHELRRRVPAGSFVAVCLERTPRMLAALLGILKAGAAYVPLDPGFPAERLSYMVEDSRAALTLSEAAVPEALRARLATIAPLLLLEEVSTAGLSEMPVVTPPVSPEGAMYAIYTSGSTGKPKGVVVPHRAGMNFLFSMAAKPGLTAADSLLAVTTISFDIAVLELFLPLLVGARIVLAGRSAAASPEQLSRLLEAESITVMQATPATWRMLLAFGWSGNPGLTILCGGEALPADLSRQLVSRCHALWNMYGPTETTVWSAIRRIWPGATTTGVEPIGRPIANTRLYIVSPNLRPMPSGCTGELCIGGDGVASGYLHLTELTRERFVRDPFVPDSAGRMYRTGDLARFQPDGTVEFLGRLDQQVKLRGFRIEPAEIEAAVCRRPEIAQCKVAMVEDVPGDARLVAWYVAAKPGDRVDAGVLRSELRAVLPEYMIPAAFIPLEAIPLTPNGKADRKALPRPETVVSSNRGAQQPSGPLETAIAGMWEEVVGVTDPDLDMNFFDAGGHSLLIIQLHQRMVSRLNATFEVLELFRHPTIRQQAALIAGDARQHDVRAITDGPAAKQRQAFARHRAMQAGRVKR
jgi:amino acid adenylation domain-containing protein